jgi:hypothetical protein
MSMSLPASHCLTTRLLTTNCSSVSVPSLYPRGGPDRKHRFPQFLYCSVHVYCGHCLAIAGCLRFCSLATDVSSRATIAVFSHHITIYIISETTFFPSFHDGKISSFRNVVYIKYSTEIEQYPTQGSYNESAIVNTFWHYVLNTWGNDTCRYTVPPL